MKFISFSEVHETEAGPVLIYKDFNPGSVAPYLLVIKAHLANGDIITSTQSYQSESSRDCDFAFPETAVKWVKNQIPKCQMLAKNKSKEVQP